MRALGFCVSVAHARVHGRRFNELGIRSWQSPEARISTSATTGLRQLASGDVNVIFSQWTSSTKASTFPRSTRSYSCARPKARPCSCSSLVGVCDGRRQGVPDRPRLHRRQRARIPIRPALPGDHRPRRGSKPSATSTTDFRSCRQAATSSSTPSRGRSCLRIFARQLAVARIDWSRNSDVSVPSSSRRSSERPGRSCAICIGPGRSWTTLRRRAGFEVTEPGPDEDHLVSALVACCMSKTTGAWVRGLESSMATWT